MMLDNEQLQNLLDLSMSEYSLPVIQAMPKEFKEQLIELVLKTIDSLPMEKLHYSMKGYAFVTTLPCCICITCIWLPDSSLENAAIFIDDMFKEDNNSTSVIIDMMSYDEDIMLSNRFPKAIKEALEKQLKL